MGAGLHIWRQGQLTRYTRTDGLPSDDICAMILEDDALWLATIEGIGRIELSDFAEYDSGERQSLHCILFGEGDGLPTRECSAMFFPNSLKSNDGRLWFTTIKGLVSVDPAQLATQNPAPKVIIDGIRVDDRDLPLVEGVAQISPGPARVAIRYGGIQLESPHRAKFQYRLEGHDEDWVNAGNEREARYTKPPPGTYRFMVRSSDNRGNWSGEAAELEVIVSPYYWQRTSFKVAIGILVSSVFGGILWLSVRMAYMSRIARAERAHLIEKERSRISKDLHDQLGAQTTQIVFQTRAIVAKLGPENVANASQHVNELHEATDQLVEELDEAIWTADPKKDNCEGLVSYISSYAENYFRPTSIRLRTDVPLDLINYELSAEIRHASAQACKEALTNVAKHSKAQEVRLRFRSDRMRLSVAIEDDGIGIPAGVRKTARNGLKNMSERLASVGGSASIEAGSQGGTVVRLDIPVGVAV